MKTVQTKSTLKLLGALVLLTSAASFAQEPAAPNGGEAAAAEKTAEEKPAEPAYFYSYRPLGKRDPFRSPLQELMAADTLVNEACTDPLCQFDLSQLDLVAVVTGDANPFAMVEDPQGRGHVVRRNTRVGRQGGKVTQILGDSITVTEYVTDAAGKSTAFPTSLRVTQDAAAAPTLDLISGKSVP